MGGSPTPLRIRSVLAMDAPTVKTRSSRTNGAKPQNNSKSRTSKSENNDAPPAPPRSATVRPEITDRAGQVQNAGLDQLLTEAASAENRFIPGVEFLKAAGLLAITAELYAAKLPDAAL